MSLAPIQVNMTVAPSTQTVDMSVDANEQTVPVTPEAEINPVINRNYNALENKPRINGVELIGDKSSAELHIDRTYIHEQNSAAAEWTITHSLGKFPSVTVVDSAGNVCLGEVQYIDENSLICRFTAAFGGKAYLN